MTKPLSFEPYLGARFQTHGSGYNLKLDSTGVQFEFGTSDSLRVEFENSDPKATVEGESPLPGKANYFPASDPKTWTRNVPTYSRVHYGHVYPGVDVSFYGTANRLEYDFLIKRGSEPNQVRMKVSGSKNAIINEAGDLVLARSNGEIRFLRPVAYQMSRDGRSRDLVSASYRLTRQEGKAEVSIALGRYDHKRELIIDPVVNALSYSEILTQSDGTPISVAADNAGNSYVLSACPVNCSGFVVNKFNSAGTLVYSSSFGTGNAVSPTQIAVDTNGQAYVVGYFDSTNSSVPVTASGFQTVPGTAATFQAFLSVISADGSSLLYGSYLVGGNDVLGSYSSYASGVAVDATGKVYMAGGTASPAWPTTPGAYDTTNPDGYLMGYVAKFDPTKSGAASLLYSTLLGTLEFGTLNGIAVDSSGNAYVTAIGSSTYPVTPGAFAYTGVWAGNGGAYVTKLNATGSALVYSAYLGYARAYGIAVEGQQNPSAYVTGTVLYPDFPTTPGAYQVQNASGFAVKMSADGSSEVYSTFISGPTGQSGTGIAAGGNIALPMGCASLCDAYIGGLTTTADIQAINAIQTAPNPFNQSAYIVELAADGKSALFSTYLGGVAAAVENAPSIALDSLGNILLAGDLDTTAAYPDFPVTISTPSSYSYSFLAKITQSASAGVLAAQRNPINFGNQPVNVSTTNYGGTISLPLSNAGSAPVAVKSIAVSPGAVFSQSNDCGSSIPAGGYCTLSLNFTPNSAVTRSGSVTVISDASNSPTVIPLTGSGYDSAFAQTSQSSLNFGSQAMGTASSQTVTVTNTGDESAGLSITNSTADFSFLANCPAQLLPGASCSVSVTFSPSQPGLRTDTLMIAYSNGPAASVSLSGTGTMTGVTSSLTLETTAIAFPPQPVGTSSTNPEVVVVINTSSIPIVLQSFVASGDYTISNVNCGGPSLSLPYQVNPQDGCAAFITFSPTATGTRTGAVTVNSSASGSPQTVELTGTGVASSQTVEFYPSSSVSFPDTPQATASGIQTIYFYNTGSAAITVDRVVVGGDFTIPNIGTNCEGITVPGSTPDGTGYAGSCQVEVQFTPSATGSRSGTLTFYDNAPDSPHVVNLSGNGITATGAIALNETGISFGTVAQGLTSVAQDIYVENPGNSSVNVTSATFSGAAASDYSVASSNCGGSPQFTLKPGQTNCYLAIQFTPMATGTRTATLTVSSSAGSQTATLTGAGVVATQAIGLTPTSLNFGALVSGQSQPVYLRNTGTEPVPFTLYPNVTGPNSRDFDISDDSGCGFASFVLAPNSNCVIYVNFTPSVYGPESATLTFTDSAGTQTIALSGTGLSANPAVYLDPYIITFGSQLLGTTDLYNYVYLYNTGSSALKLGNVSFTGQFSSVPGGDTCSGQSIAAKTGSCYVTVRFSAASAGYQTGTLTFNDRSGNPLTVVPSVPLAGYATTPIYTAAISPLAANFAEEQPVGIASSTAYPIYLNNTGNAPLKVGTLSGTNFGTGTSGGSAEFTDGSSSGSFDGCSGQTILPGNKCEVSVLFTPNTSGTRTGSVTFPVTYLNNSTATFTATLTGTGLVEHNSAVLTPPNVAFLDQAVGVSTPYPATVYLNNSGTHPFIVGSLSNTNGTEFPVSDACSGQSVPAGSNCSIVVNFTPSATGARSGTIKFPITFADHTAQTLSLPVSGKGITGAGKTIVIAPSNAQFTPQIQSTTGASYAFQLIGTGSAPVTIGTDSITTNSAEFAISRDGCGGSELYPGASCWLYVTFTPGASSTGTRTGVLTIADNATGGPHTIPLAGIAIPASQQLLVSASSLNFGNQPAGSASAAQAIYFSNQSGSSAVTINSIAIGGANALDFQIQSNTCVTGTSLYAYCAVTIQFVPASGASGALTATLTETDSAKPGTHTVTLTGTATVPSPAVALYPASLTFATQNVGSTSAAQNFSVTNTGTANLTITALSSTNPTEFPIALDSCSGTTLTPGQRCVAGVEFAPSLGGTRTGSIKVADNASGSPQVLSVSGVGYGIPSTTLMPSSLTFGNTNINVTSAAQSTTLKNSGTDTLVISSIAITGGNATEFTQTNTCGASLAPAASCVISVTFKPTAAGSQNASVTITDNANNVSGSSQTVALSGTGVADPAAALSPAALTFSGTNVGVTSAAQTATLTNNGSGPLSISSISISGTNASDFSATNDCGSSLAAASSCAISITFDPAAVGSRSATLTATDNAGNTSGSTQTVALSGTGVGVSTASVSPTSVVFGDQNVGTTSAAQLVTLSNSGTAALTITSISVGGTNSADFSETNTCSTSLAAGSSCSISVTFKPGAAGNRTGTITVTDNSNNTPGSTQTVSLYGTGVGVPTAGVSPASVTFAATSVGTTAAAQTVTVSNTGTGPLTITQIVIGGTNPGDFSETTNCGATLGADSTCSISVTFTPLAVGSFTANLHVIDNSGNTGSTQTVTLAGTGATATAGLTPSSLTFATETVGFTSTAQTLTLSNSGPVALTIASISVGGKDPGEFAETNNCGASLAAAASCTISVTFTPLSAGSQTATVVVTDNSGGVSGATQTSTLTGTGTTSSAPTVVSLSPASGSGTTQTFTAVYSDPSGISNIANVRILFNTYLYGTNACYAYYYPGTNALYLENDEDGGTLGPLTPGASSTLSNSQCTLNGSGTTVNTSGNNITVAFSLTFASSFAGSKEVFLAAFGSSVSKGWIEKGNWTIPPTPGPIAALTPSLLGFAPQAEGTTGYSQPMYLSNVGTTPLAIASIALGGADPSEFAETNNCGASLAAGASCLLNVTFTPSSAGSQTATVVITDNSGGVSGATQTAALTGTGINPSAPAPVSLSPNSGTGAGQIFTAAYTYPGGITSLSNVRILLNNSNAPLNGANACYAYYYPDTNALYLENDANNGTVGPLTPGSSSSISNSQCTLNGSGTTVSTSGNNITVAYSVTFSSTFTGLKDVYLLAAGASLSNGWIPEGTWMVTTTPTPTAAITPSSLTFPTQP